MPPEPEVSSIREVTEPVADRQTFRYDAFISYSRKDTAFAAKLEAELEAYHPPKDVLPDRPPLNIFRDVEDISGTELRQAIREGLSQSRYLIVICSPNSYSSEWIGREVEYFVEVHPQQDGKQHIIPVLLAGRPNREAVREGAPDEKAFPEALCACWKEDEEPLAPDFREAESPETPKAERKDLHRENLFMILAELLGKDKAKLLQRQRARERRRNRVMAAIGVAVLLAMAGLTIWAILNAAEARRQARVALSRQLAAQSKALVDDGQPDLAMLLAIAADSVASTVEARGALLHGIVRELGPDAQFSTLYGQVTCVAFSPDGNTLASGGDDGTVALWDVATHRQTGGPFTRHTDAVTDITFSPDGKLLVSAGRDCAVYLWDVAGGRPTYVLMGPEVTTVAVSPDGEVLALGHRDGTVGLLDVRDRHSMDAPGGHSSWVNCLEFSPFGSTLASGSFDSTVILWDVTTTSIVPEPAVHLSAAPVRVWFVGDGRTAAILNNDGSFTQLGPDRQPRNRPPLAGRRGTLCDVAFSPDGRELASVADDTVVVLWDWAEWRRIGELIPRRRSDPSCLFYNADGRILAVGHIDGIVTIWDVDIDSWIAKAKRIANRELTPVERQQYLGTE